MASEVTKSNLLMNSWQNVYDLINNKSNVSDPTTSSSVYRKWIYSREPDVKANDFTGFPYIIINPSTLTFDNSQTGNSQIQNINWTIEIEVVTSDRGFNNQNGKGQTHNDAISDDILETLNNSTNRNTLRDNGLYFFKPNITAVNVEEFSNTLIYRRSFLVGFRSKKKVF
jgi:hypothetical protein